MYNPQFSLDSSSSTSDSFLLSDEVLSNGGFLIYILILVYCCLGLAVICDAYFVPAIQKLSQAWDLSPDIAGSTLMAMGASVPELFASLIGVFVTEDDIGTGSIIGSACFNLIAVPAACAFIAATTFDRKLVLAPFPIIRNSAFYAITILVLVLVIKDNLVDIPEATILLVMFVLYMVFMMYSTQISSYFPILGDSLMSSTSSSDSAIDCKGGNLKDHGNGNHILITHMNGMDGLPPNKHKVDNNGINNKQPQTVIRHSERTPLVGAVGAATTTTLEMEGDRSMVTTCLYPPLADTLNGQTDNNRCPSWAATYVFEASRGSTTPVSNHAANNHVSTAQHDDLGRLNYGTILHNDNQRNGIIMQASNLVDLDDHIDCNNIRRAASLDSSPYVDRQRQKQATVINLMPAIASSPFENKSLTLTTAKGLSKHLIQQPLTYDEHAECWVQTKWIMIPMLPVTIMMTILTPKGCRSAFWALWTFIVSIMMIGILTYVAVWSVHLFGQWAGIPESVAGITILSWGTGIPELIASIVLIKKTAQADMAVCNAIGSNVIDLSFCLSVPWIIKCLISMSAGEKAQVQIQSAALPVTCLTLLVTVLALIFTFKLNNWAMTIKVGLWLTFIYIIFVCVACYLEYTFDGSEVSLLSP